MTRILARLASLALLPALLAAGCGEAPEPKPLPSSSPSGSTASPSPTGPSAPVMPGAVKQKTKKGAEALVLHFLDALNYAGASGDTAPLRETYVAFCTRCEGLADGIDKVYEADGYIRGGDWIRPKLRFYAIHDGVAYVDAVVAYSAQDWNQSHDAQPAHIPASAGHLHAFQLRWLKAQGWRVGALDPNK